MHGHIVAVRHDLPHVPSLGVSSLDSGRRGDMAASFFCPAPFLTGPFRGYSAASRPPPDCSTMRATSASAAASSASDSASARAVLTIARSSI